MQRIKVANKIHGKYPHFINLSGPKDSHPKENAYILVGFVTGRLAKEIWSEKTEEEIVI